jgi:hypothetical protein
VWNELNRNPQRRREPPRIRAVQHVAHPHRRLVSVVPCRELTESPPSRQ